MDGRMRFALRRFRNAVVASGLLSRHELRAFERAMPRAARPGDAAALARSLIEAGRLSDYQASEIAAGRGGGLLLGNYAIVSPLGAGGMGRVFKAWHRRMGRTVALKTLADQNSADAEIIERFRREVRLAAQLAHPNIVAAYDADEAGGICFLVMEYVEGPNLSELVRRHGPLPVESATRYLLDAAHGLAHAHARGFVHRDVKPSNLVLAPDDTVKVLDLGLARGGLSSGGQPAAGGELTRAGDVVGTVEYMAPEQARETRLADHRADIYGLGSTLYRLLTGELMYRGDSPLALVAAHREQPIPALRKARGDVPRGLDAAYQKMVAKDPAERFQNMHEVITALSKPPARRRGKPNAATASGFSAEHARGPAATAERPLSRAESLSGDDLLIVSPSAEISGRATGTAVQPVPSKAADRPRWQWLVVGGLLTVAMAAMLVSRRPETAPVDQGDRPERNAVVLPDELSRQWASYLQIPAMVSNSVGMRLVLIPPGSFVAPSQPGTRTGQVASAFYCGAHEVTVGEFRRFVDETGYRTTAERDAASGSRPHSGTLPTSLASSWRHPAALPQGDRHPVVELTPADADAFCGWLSGREQARYRLPTDDEWEHACRAGGRAAWWFGDDPSFVERFAWYGRAAQRRTHLVGLLEPNPFGLHDLLGNAAEWCRASEATDSQSAGSVSLRGGAWSSADAQELSTSGKTLMPAGGHSTASGFRVVLEITD
jgi:serine/threonine protein kinase